MRISIHVDSATEKELRLLARAMHRCGHTGELTIGCDGPNKFNAATPKVRIGNGDFERIVDIVDTI